MSHSQLRGSLARVLVTAGFALLTIAAWPIDHMEALFLLWLATALILIGWFINAFRQPLTVEDATCSRIDQDLDELARRRRAQERAAQCATRPRGHVAEVVPMYGRLRSVDDDGSAA